MAETWSGNDGCGGRKWRRWMTTAADDNSSDGRRQQQQTTTAVDNNGTQDQVADYKGEGGECMANNNGIRAHREESMKK
jgi:hypothetical protein